MLSPLRKVVTDLKLSLVDPTVGQQPQKMGSFGVLDAQHCPKRETSIKAHGY